MHKESPCRKHKIQQGLSLCMRIVYAGTDITNEHVHDAGKRTQTW